MPTTQFSSAAIPAPAVRERLTLVGTVVLNTSVVQDEIDANGPTSVILTPALTKRLQDCCSNFSFTYLQLQHGGRDVATVEDEIEHVIPANLPYDFYDSSIDVTKAQNAIKPEAIALGVFGLIAALATILIAGQVIGRQLGFWTTEERVLRVLGADPAMTVVDGTAGLLAAVLLGALLAGAVAVVLSPLAPLGPVRPYDPHPGVAVDWTVIGFGMLALILVLGVLAVALAVLRDPHRLALRQRRPRTPSHLARGAANAGLGVSAVAGIRFALEPGAETEAVPVRSAILGAALALTVIVATIVFGSSLNSLVSHPRLYGWNWSDALLAGGGPGDVPAGMSSELLARDPSVAAWSGYWFGNLQIDGRTVPVLGTTPKAVVAPPVLTGHGYDATDQIVLGPGTLEQLHKQVGDVVTVRYGTTAAHRLRIVGTATLPAVGVAGVTGHPSMGTGAVVPYTLLPASVRNQFNVTPTGPNVVFVRLKPGVHSPAAMRSLDRIATKMSLPTNYRDAGPVGATPGRDRELPVHGRHPAHPRPRTDRRSRDRSRVDPHRLGPPPASLRGHAANPRLHRSPTGRCRGLAGVGGRRHRPGGRRAARDRARAPPVGPLRRPDLRGAQPDGTGAPRRGHRPAGVGAGEPRSRHPGAHRGAHAGGAALAHRVGGRARCGRC